MATGRYKQAQDAFRAVTDATRGSDLEFLTSPGEFASGLVDEIQRYPEAIPWGLGGAALGFLAGVPATRAVWRGGRALMDTGLGQRADDAVRAFSQTKPARFFSSKEFGLPQLRPLSKRTIPFLGAGAGAHTAYNVGRRRAEEDRFGAAPSDQPYVYIPMR